MTCMQAALESASGDGIRNSTQRKSIVMLVPGFPANEAETDCLPAVQNFVKAIAGRNPHIVVHVISFQYPFERGSYMWNAANVHAFAGRNRRFPIRFRTWFQAGWRVRRLIASQDVIALHSFWLGECSYVGAWLSRMMGKKHIATICGQDALSDNPYLKRLPLDKMTITAGSVSAAEAFRESTGRSVDHIVPTGLDSEALSAPPEGSTRSIDILGVGSLSSIKDFRSFVEIIAVLAPDHPGMQCLILGDGPDRASLERQIQEKRLEHVIKLAGHVSREEVLKMMRRSRILLHTSRYEGQGYVFLEALASGTQVVSREVGYTGNGTNTHRCKSDEEMVAVLQRLLIASGENKKANVESIDCTARTFEKIYGIV